MKQKIIVLVICTLLGNHLFAQLDDSTLVFENPEVSIKRLSGYLLDSRGKDSTKITSNATLNTFFATKVSTYLSEASDLSLSKAYAVLDNSDGRLFLGGTFNSKESNQDFRRLLFSVGIKANVKDGFANLFGTDGFNNDIGFSLKTTILGAGYLCYYKDNESQKGMVREKRRLLARELLYEFDRELSKTKKDVKGLSDSITPKNIFISEYETDMREEFSKKEADYLIKKRPYNIAHTWWIGIDVYLPFTESKYKVAQDFTTTNIRYEVYRPFEAKITGTYFIESCAGTLLFNLNGSIIANNSVNASQTEAYSFDTYLTQNTVIDTVFLAKLQSQSIYVGKFEQFITPRLSARFVYMPWSFVGFSAAIEQSFYKVQNLNWRVGIPMSFKDEDGKSNVNFEIVWREINKQHSIGVSVGLPIGETIF